MTSFEDQHCLVLKPFGDGPYGKELNIAPSGNPALFDSKVIRDRDLCTSECTPVLFISRKRKRSQEASWRKRYIGLTLEGRDRSCWAEESAGKLVWAERTGCTDLFT
jgi:hypothetical protein